MPDLNEIFPLIDKLDANERQELLFALSGLPSSPPDSPLIVSTPDVCGGAARLIRTRVPVWVLERMRQLGIPEARILQSFPSLRPADIIQAWSYAAAHREEIEQAI